MLSIFTALRALLEWLGLWENETARKIKEVKAQIEQSNKELSVQNKKLEELKGVISKTQEQIFAKDAERKTQTGKIREITEREIELLFKKFKATEGERDLILRNIEGLNTTIAKLKQLLTGLVPSTVLNTGNLEGIRETLEDNIEDIKEQDSELESLESVTYKSKASKSDSDLEAQLAALHGETRAATENVSAKTSEPRYDMPEKKTELPRFDMPEKTAEPTKNEIDALLQSLRNSVDPGASKTKIEE